MGHIGSQLSSISMTILAASASTNTGVQPHTPAFLILYVTTMPNRATMPRAAPQGVLFRGT